MRHLTEHDVLAWVEDSLFSPRRTKPIVAVTTIQGSDLGTWLPPAQIEQALGDAADVVLLETGEPTWVLTETVPPRLDVYGGAMRIWWPGLTRDANPYDHRLFLVRDAVHAEQVLRELARTLGGAAAPAADRGGAAAPVRVRVAAMSLDEVEVATSEPLPRRGPITHADLPLAMLVELLLPGCQLDARPLQQRADGSWTFSLAGLLPDAWPRFAAAVQVGDVFVCRVQNLHEQKRLVFVDVLPHLVGVCHVRELDYEFVQNLDDYVQPGELVAFAVIELDAAHRRLQLSRKRAFTAEPKPLPPLFDGGRPFVWRAGLPSFGRRREPGDGDAPQRTVWHAPAAGPGSAAPAAAERIAGLEQELLAEREGRQALVAQIRVLREQLQEVRREQRAAEQRAELHARRGDAAEPLASERAFLHAVRAVYARTFDEDDRIDRPLQRMRVGREFLQSVRDTQGIDVDKIVEVCVEVAADIAHKKAGRDVHPLRAGERGADARTRKRDGAKAWRCALQVNSPSARRLHWWNVPGTDGATIEFACVGLHDSVDIPD